MSSHDTNVSSGSAVSTPRRSGSQKMRARPARLPRAQHASVRTALEECWKRFAPEGTTLTNTADGREPVLLRSFLMLIMHEVVFMSVEAIAELLGSRNSQGVHYQIQALRSKISQDPSLTVRINETAALFFDTSPSLIYAKPSQVVAAVSEHYRTPRNDLLKKEDGRKETRERQILMYMLRTHARMKFRQIKEMLGIRNRQNVHQAIGGVQRKIESDPDVADEIRHIAGKLPQQSHISDTEAA